MAVELTTTYGYDLDGNEISATDPMHNVTTIGYDAFGNQISQSLPNPTTGLAGGPTTSYTFDAMGDVLSLTDPDGNTTSWTYDGLGDETSQSEVVSLGYYPGTQTLEPTITATSTYQYDLDGNLTESVDANANAPAGYGFTGEVNTYSYNATNQETGESWYGNTTDAAAGGDNVGSIAHSYDAEGRMLTAANAAGGSSIASYTYGYDGVGNLTSDNVQLGDLPGSDNVLLTSEYDFNGDRTSLSANIGGTLNTDGTVSGGISDFTNTYGYDNLGNMTSIVQTGGDGTTPKCVTLSYDADNRLTGIDRHASDGNSNLVTSSAYTYDHDSELTDLSYREGVHNAGGLPLAAQQRRPGDRRLLAQRHGGLGESLQLPDLVGHALQLRRRRPVGQHALHRVLRPPDDQHRPIVRSQRQQHEQRLAGGWEPAAD